jgi:hypothetical protein
VVPNTVPNKVSQKVSGPSQIYHSLKFFDVLADAAKAVKAAMEEFFDDATLKGVPSSRKLQRNESELVFQGRSFLLHIIL